MTAAEKYAEMGDARPVCSCHGEPMSIIQFEGREYRSGSGSPFIGAKDRWECRRARTERARARIEQADFLLAAVRRTRGDGSDLGGRDHRRRGTNVVQRQRPAMVAAGYTAGEDVEFKHADVLPDEYFSAVGKALFRDAAGMPMLPLVVQRESALLAEVCSRHGIELRVEEVAA